MALINFLLLDNLFSDYFINFYLFILLVTETLLCKNCAYFPSSYIKIIFLAHFICYKLCAGIFSPLICWKRKLTPPFITTPYMKLYESKVEL